MNIVLKRKLLIFLLAGVLLGLAGSEWYHHSNSEQETGKQNTAQSSENAIAIPRKVYETLKHIDAFGQAREGYKGGAPFFNYEKRLPGRDPQGDLIRYREWDVNPKIKGKNRGTERLVTGSDQSAWYTHNHYKSFIKIR